METDRPAAKFVVGLGNPQRRYAGTRHNTGFMVLRELRRRHELGRGRTKFHARLWTGRVGAAKVVLAAPRTYVNRSGVAVAEMMAFYKADPESVLVVMDEMALPTGRLRARTRGSAGGHKGLADILRAVGTDELSRLRLGIGRPPEPMDAVDYVLSRFDENEKNVMERAVRRAADAVEDWVVKGITYVMDHYNQDNCSSQVGKGTR